jgi:hypothetical protein
MINFIKNWNEHQDFYSHTMKRNITWSHVITRDRSYYHVRFFSLFSIFILFDYTVFLAVFPRQRHRSAPSLETTCTDRQRPAKVTKNLMWQFVTYKVLKFLEKMLFITKNGNELKNSVTLFQVTEFLNEQYLVKIRWLKRHQFYM